MDTGESIVREEGRSDPVSAGRVRTGVVERVAFCAMSQRESRTGAAWRRESERQAARSDSWRAIASSFWGLLVFVIFTRRCAGIAAVLLWLACVTRADAVTRAASRRAPRPFPFLSFPFSRPRSSVKDELQGLIVKANALKSLISRQLDYAILRKSVWNLMVKVSLERNDNFISANRMLYASAVRE